MRTGAQPSLDADRALMVRMLIAVVLLKAGVAAVLAGVLFLAIYLVTGMPGH